MSAAETHMDLDRITHPLRLARGSHQPGSGKGCAMNVISYTNGDDRITDFPTCSARPLAVVVQACNDLLAGPSGYLSPEHSVLAIELAWQTVGTAGVADTVVHAWLAELLTNPVWGVVQYVKITEVKAILDIAELHRQAARGDMPAIAAWDAADRAVQVYGGRGWSTLYRPGRHLQDVRVCRIYEGTDEILKLKVAAAVLGKEFEAYS